MAMDEGHIPEHLSEWRVQGGVHDGEYATQGAGLAFEIYKRLREIQVPQGTDPETWQGLLDDIDNITKILNQDDIDAGLENTDGDGLPDPIIVEPEMGPDPEKQRIANMKWTSIANGVAKAVVEHIRDGGDEGNNKLQTIEAEEQLIYLRQQNQNLASQVQVLTQKVNEMGDHIKSTNNTVIADNALAAIDQGSQLFHINSTNSHAIVFQSFLSQLFVLLPQLLVPATAADDITAFWTALGVHQTTLQESIDTQSLLALTTLPEFLIDLAVTTTMCENTKGAVDNTQADLPPIDEEVESIKSLMDAVSTGTADHVI